MRYLYFTVVFPFVPTTLRVSVLPPFPPCRADYGLLLAVTCVVKRLGYPPFPFGLAFGIPPLFFGSPRAMWTPPIWSLSMVDILWIGSTRSAMELRDLKKHLSNGGTAYGRSTLNGDTMVVTFVDGSPQQPRTAEAGVILSVDVIKSTGPMNLLEEETDRFGQVYITRDGVNRLPIHTIREYHLAAKPLTQLHNDVDQLPLRGVLSVSALRMYSALANLTKSGVFFLSQGNFFRVL